MKKQHFRVYYSQFVNGTEYPENARFSAASEKEAEKQLDAMMKKHGITDYRIKETLKTT